MSKARTEPSSSPGDIRVPLSESELHDIDSWIAERPEPRPTREEAAQFFLTLGLSNNRTLKAIMGYSYFTDEEIYSQIENAVFQIDITQGELDTPTKDSIYLKF